MLIFPMQGDKFDAAPGKLVSQRIAIVAAVAYELFELLPGTPSLMPRYADRLQRRLDDLTSEGEAK